MSLVAIADACAVECVRQKAFEINDLRNLLAAYERLTIFGGQMFESHAGFMTFSKDIEPTKNSGYTYRQTPVTFANGGSSCHPQRIPDKMSDLIDAIVEAVEIEGFFTSSVEERDFPARLFTKEFLWIHPFEDANGRIGFLLYNYLRGTIMEPVALPDFKW